MNSIALSGRESGVSALLRAGFPEYRGRRIRCEITNQVCPGCTWWDDGNKYEYAAVQLETLRAVPGHSFAPPQFGGPNAVRDIRMVPGVAVLEHHYMGQHDSMTIYVHPADAPRMLPPPADVESDEKTVLVFTRALKSSYAGIKDFRFKEAERKTGISKSSWDAAKATCIAKGLLNRAGAITADGRNAVDDVDVCEWFWTAYGTSILKGGQLR